MRRKVCKTSKTLLASLPDHIMTEIMFRLPIKSIIMCKCTCKALRHLISSTDFVKLHYARAKPCILLANIMTFDCYMSRLVYLIEPNNMSCISDDSCVCSVNDPSEGVNLKLDTQLKNPTYDGKHAWINGDYVLVNSCNGFLCLYRGHCPQTYVVCNPVTNEYLKVPSPVNYIGWNDVSRGFGFCPKTKQYKVVRWLRSTDRETPVTAEIHTLEVHKRWRTLVDTPLTTNFRSLDHPMYANGFIFWVYCDSPRSYCVVSFELEVERFRSLPKPPIYRQTDVRMEMIGDRPSLCSRPSRAKIDIWTIEAFGGVSEHWSKYVSIDIINIPRFISADYTCLITTCSKCETSFLLYHLDNQIMIYESKRQKWRSFKIHQNNFEAKPTIYTPSFFSLKDAVPGANVKSISAGFIWPPEKMPPYFKEEVSVAGST